MVQAGSQDPNLLGRPPMQSYPAIEAIVSSGDVKAINASFKEAYDKLEHIVKEGKGLGRVAQAKKAIRSLELTADLLRHLFQIKHMLAEKKKEMQASAGTQGRKL